MDIESVDRHNGIVYITASHEDGGFIGDSTRDNPVQRAVSSVVELHITRPFGYGHDFDALETGDKEVLAQYLVPDEDRPGRYTFVEGCYGWLQDTHSAMRCVDGLIEYSPFAETTEHLEVA